MEQIECRVTTLETEQSKIKFRLDEHQKKIDNIEKLTLAIEKMAMKMDTLSETVGGMNSRLQDIEKAPGVKFEKIKDTIVSVIISAVIGGILGAILTLIIK